MAGVVGVPEGEGPWLSSRTVDDAASGRPRSRAWTGGGACVPGQPGAGHGVQNPRPGRGETAQSAILPGAARSRLCGKDGRSAVRLSPSENLEKGGGCVGKETRAWVAEQPAHRFEFTFTPTHGSWLNLVEGFFSKLARSVLRHIRVASKQELKDRIMAAMDYFNQQPSFTPGPSSSIRLLDMIRISETLI